MGPWYTTANLRRWNKGGTSECNQRNKKLGRPMVPTYETLQKLAKALNCSVADLTGEGKHRSFAATRGGRS